MQTPTAPSERTATIPVTSTSRVTAASDHEGIDIGVDPLPGVRPRALRAGGDPAPSPQARRRLAALDGRPGYVVTGSRRSPAVHSPRSSCGRCAPVRRSPRPRPTCGARSPPGSPACSRRSSSCAATSAGGSSPPPRWRPSPSPGPLRTSPGCWPASSWPVWRRAASGRSSSQPGPAAASRLVPAPRGGRPRARRARSRARRRRRATAAGGLPAHRQRRDHPRRRTLRDPGRRRRSPALARGTGAPRRAGGGHGRALRMGGLPRGRLHARRAARAGRIGLALVVDEPAGGLARLEPVHQPA